MDQKLSRLFIALGLFVICGMPASRADQTSDAWPQWRGAQGDNKAADAQPPIEWGPEKNVLWRTESPGRGHSSPTVAAGRVFLTSADEENKVQMVVAYDQATGKPLWRTDLFEGGFDKKTHERNSQASCTVACSDQAVFASFLNDGNIWLVSLDFDGEERWRRNLGPFVSNWGYPASPTLYDSLVLVAADHSGGGFLTAVDQKSGDTVWTQPRPKKPSYCSPVVHRIDGRDQVLLCGCDRVSSYDPATGNPLWETKATTTECVGSVVSDSGLAFASGGYPASQTVAVRCDGSGEVAWRNKVKVYVPSLIVHNGFLYAANDSGIAFCWDAVSGKQLWKHRLGGVFNASIVLAGDILYAPAEDGTTHLFKPGTEDFEAIGENKLGDEVYATPTFVGDRIYFRVAEMQGDKRQEYLYCIGKPNSDG